MNDIQGQIRFSVMLCSCSLCLALNSLWTIYCAFSCSQYLMIMLHVLCEMNYVLLLG